MDFQFEWDSGVEASTISAGILYQCDESDCSDAAPLEEVGPQALYCEPEACSATGYGFAPYNMLEIEFSDGVTRRSNVFEQIDFESYYAVHVRAEDLLVEPLLGREAPPEPDFDTQSDALPGWALISIGCLCLFALAAMAAGLVLFLRRRARA
jgi:hypothetical protein